MPKQTGIYKKKIKQGYKYYGAKWFKGKTYVTSLYPTAERAVQAREELIRKLNRGLLVDKKNVTVKEFIKLYYDKYISSKKLDVLTFKSIKSKLHRGVIEYIGDRKLQSLTSLDMQDLQNKLLLKYKSGSARVIIQEFKRALRRAVVWDYIVKDPSVGLDSISVEFDKPDILEPEQIISILCSERIELRTRCIIGFGGMAGLRISEVFAIQKNKVNFNDKTVYINLQYSKGKLKTPKSGSIRTVPILPDFEPILKQWYLKCGTDWLFTGQGGGPQNPESWFDLRFKPLLRELGLTVIKFHALRHGFNKMLNDSGVPPREVMQIMGHKSRKMTFETYDRESVERLVQVTRDIRFRTASVN